MKGFTAFLSKSWENLFHIFHKFQASKNCTFPEVRQRTVRIFKGSNPKDNPDEMVDVLNEYLDTEINDLSVVADKWSITFLLIKYVDSEHTKFVEYMVITASCIHRPNFWQWNLSIVAIIGIVDEVVTVERWPKHSGWLLHGFHYCESQQKSAFNETKLTLYWTIQLQFNFQAWIKNIGESWLDQICGFGSVKFSTNFVKLSTKILKLQNFVVHELFDHKVGV